MKTVIRVELFNFLNYPSSTHSKIFTLTCGHQIIRKCSYPTPKMCKCNRCEGKRDN